MYHTVSDSFTGTSDDAPRSMPGAPDAFFRRLLAKYQAMAASRPRIGARIRTTDLYTAENAREERLWRKDAIARHLAAPT